MGDIGLGLVVVVVGDEILHRVVGKELLELGAELGGQGLVVGQHQGGPLDLLDDLGHGEGLARAGDAQKHLMLEALFNALSQRGDGLRLIARGLIIGMELEFGHGSPPPKANVCFHYTTKRKRGSAGALPPRKLN